MVSTLSGPDFAALELLAANRGMATGTYARTVLEQHLMRNYWDLKLMERKAQLNRASNEALNQEIQIRRIEPLTGKTFP